MNVPLYTSAEARARETFLALMWALSYPGRSKRLSTSSPYADMGAALLDLETSFYTPDAELETVLRHTGARSLPSGRAAYHFYPALTVDHLGELKNASVGTMQYPDQSATLVIGCTLGQGSTVDLSGAGIQGVYTITIGGIPAEFWTLRQQIIRYPLGWDIFLVSGQDVIGIPRSTRIGAK